MTDLKLTDADEGARTETGGEGLDGFCCCFCCCRCCSSVAVVAVIVAVVVVKVVAARGDVDGQLRGHGQRCGRGS